MDSQKAIKLMEYSKSILGTSDQGNSWKPNANTIACDMAISALQEQAAREKGCPICNDANATKDQQIATLKKALELASEEVNKAFETLESHHVITMFQKGSVRDNVDTWIHQAQEQEGKK